MYLINTLIKDNMYLLVLGVQTDDSNLCGMYYTNTRTQKCRYNYSTYTFNNLTYHKQHMSWDSSWWPIECTLRNICHCHTPSSPSYHDNPWRLKQTQFPTSTTCYEDVFATTTTIRTFKNKEFKNAKHGIVFKFRGVRQLYCFYYL